MESLAYTNTLVQNLFWITLIFWFHRSTNPDRALPDRNNSLWINITYPCITPTEQKTKEKRKKKKEKYLVFPARRDLAFLANSKSSEASTRRTRVSWLCTEKVASIRHGCSIGAVSFYNPNSNFSLRACVFWGGFPVTAIREREKD